ncbi:beta-N-acetylglucosaminidase domain-containing protein [Clostridium sp. LP20]|uniref:beta-N-acetylglucosaminidase domain-containing protein n=1 Tax=Clostridium sp. LP20 TaxID=3418665 RepID=UPI003EE67FD9
MKRKFIQTLGLLLATTVALDIAPITVSATEGVLKELGKAGVSQNLKFTQMPKEVKLGEGKIDFDNSVNLIGVDQADTEAVNLLKTILKNLGINVNDVEVPGVTTIYIGESDDNIPELNDALASMSLEGSESLTDEGYVLATKDKEDGDQVVISGKDERGTYYGVQTLKQILTKENEKTTADEVIIRDEPSMKIRAVVEGFYGTPWSHQDRLDQFKLYGENKLNAYIYAPKDDPYHRDKWREPYPQEDLARMKELIDTAKENKVDFVFAISPGLDIKLEEGTDGTAEEIEEDFQALINKSEALYNMGVRSFSILWDDIQNQNGTKQAEVLNRFNREFIQKKNAENKDNPDGQVTPLITVPVQYWGTSMYDGDNAKEYTKNFASTLDKEIEVMWTGQDVVPKGVTNADAQKVKNTFGRDMMLWWNYPVNDYMTDKMGLGPMYGLDKNLDDHVSGFIINPMEFAEASKISTITGADYGWNTKGYDYNRSWDVALETITKEAKDAFKVFADHSTRLDTGRADSPELNNEINSLWTKWDNGENVDAELNKLMSDFENIKKTPALIRSTLKNEKLLKEVDKHLNKFEKYGDAGIEAINILKAIKVNDVNKFWTSKYKCTVLLRELEGMEGKVANLVVEPFIKKAHEVGNKYFDGNTTDLKDKTYVYEELEGNMPFHKFTSWYLGDDFHSSKYMFDDKMDTGFWSQETVKAGDFVGFELENVEKIKNVSLKMGKNVYSDEIIKSGVIEYSVDGTTWKELKTLDGSAEIVAESDVEAKYIRVRATEDTENKVFIKDFKVNTDRSGLTSVGSVDLSGVTVSKSVEDIEEVATLKKGGDIKLKKGETVGIALEEVKNIVAVEAGLKGKNDNVVIESSFDNVEWTKVAEGSSFRQLRPVVGKYFRVKALDDVTLNEFKVYSEGRIASKIDTNIRISTNQEIKPEYMIDDDYGTAFVCSDQIEEGKYVTLDFGKTINIRDVKLVQGPGGDFINKGKISYSNDGTTWTDITEEFGETEIVVKDLNINARYLKMEATGRRDRWLRIREFSVNNLVEEYVTVSSAKGTYVDRAENVRDNDLYTGYIPERDIVAGDYLLYRIFDNKLVSKVTIPQGENNISNAKVIAQTIDGELLELGKLDKGYNEFNLDTARQLVSIKLQWEANAGRPEIYEVKPTFVSVESQKEAIKNVITDAENLLNEFKDKDNAERKDLEAAMARLRGLLADPNASDEEILRAYSDLFAKMDAFRNSVGDSGDGEDTNKPGDGEDTDKPGDGEGTDKPGNGDEANKPEDGGASKPEGSTSKPSKTGDTAGILGLFGTAVASLGGVIALKKRKKK